MSIASDSSKMLDLMQLAGKLKHMARTGWVLRDIKAPESIAGHMYRMTLMAFLLEDDASLDRVKCMEMSLIHDLGEAIIGDITPFCGVSREEKAKKEMEAMIKISNIANNQRILELFKEYEEQKSAEARLVKELDLADMAIQAWEYEKTEEKPGRLQEFINSTKGRFSHPAVVAMIEEMYSQRDTAIAGQKSS